MSGESGAKHAHIVFYKEIHVFLIAPLNKKENNIINLQVTDVVKQ